jgi:hypothetical protein
MSDRFDIVLPIGKLVEHLMHGRRLYGMTGTVSVEHIAPFAQYGTPRLTPQQAAEIESTFLLRSDAVGPDGRSTRRVFYNATDAVWAFLREAGGSVVVRAVDVPTNETDELSMGAIQEGLLQNFRKSETK